MFTISIVFAVIVALGCAGIALFFKAKLNALEKSKKTEVQRLQHRSQRPTMIEIKSISINFLATAMKKEDLFSAYRSLNSTKNLSAYARVISLS